MKKILLATVAVLGLVGAASAADLRPLPAQPLVVPVFNWTGCYLGGYVGGAWGAENVRVLDVNGAISPSGAWSYDTKSSFLGGGTLGCNWQPIGSPFVLGIEGELGYLRLTGSAIDPFDPAPEPHFPHEDRRLVRYGDRPPRLRLGPRDGLRQGWRGLRRRRDDGDRPVRHRLHR